jgi:hypothetical protein
MIDKKGKGGKLGACFTPDWVSDIAASATPEGELKRYDFKVSDPCCGSGSLISAVVRRRLKLGVPKNVTANNLWACDLDPSYVEQCREHLIELLGEDNRDAIISNVVEGSYLDFPTP